MIPIRRIAGFETCFHAYLQWSARRAFRGIWVDPALRFPAGGFIAAPNHTSWWDGFVPFLVQRALAPQTPFAIMMSEAQLRRFPFFRWGGAFSVDANSPRAARESVEYAAHCARNGAGVWIFPQGRLCAPGADLGFTAGFEHAARRAGVPIVPIALRYALLEAREPDAFLSAGNPIDPSVRTARDRTVQAVAQMLARLDREISGGSAVARRRSVISRRAGVDDVVGSLTAPWGRLL